MLDLTVLIYRSQGRQFILLLSQRSSVSVERLPESACSGCRGGGEGGFEVLCENCIGSQVCDIEKPAEKVPDPVYPQEEVKSEVSVVTPPIVKKPTRGTLTHVHTPQGLYYIVVGSFVDSDLAADHAKKLTRKGTDVAVIAPAAGKYFYRVAVEKKQNFQEVQHQLEALKATYGPRIWILKY